MAARRWSRGGACWSRGASTRARGTSPARWRDRELEPLEAPCRCARRGGSRLLRDCPWPCRRARRGRGAPRRRAGCAAGRACSTLRAHRGERSAEGRLVAATGGRMGDADDRAEQGRLPAGAGVGAGMFMGEVDRTTGGPRETYRGRGNGAEPPCSPKRACAPYRPREHESSHPGRRRASRIGAVTNLPHVGAGAVLLSQSSSCAFAQASFAN